jgi:GTPase KRas
MMDQLIRSSDGFLLFYDISGRNVFNESMKVTAERILRGRDEDFYPMVLVGTKCDLENERKIITEEGLEFAKKYAIPFFETSAKVCINVDEVIFSIIEEILKKREKNYSRNIKKEKDCLLM